MSAGERVADAKVGLFVVAAIHMLFLVPLATALVWYAIAAYLVVGFAWSSLNWRTYAAAIRGNNVFVMLALCLFAVIADVQDDYEAFPTWATALIVVGAIAGYSVMGVCGFRNFRRWRRGDFRLR